MSARELTITKLERGEVDGRECWTANVTYGGSTFLACDPFGSWEGRCRVAPRSRRMRRFHPPVEVCRALSSRVRPIERKAAKVAEEAKAS